jgi:porin
LLNLNKLLSRACDVSNAQSAEQSLHIIGCSGHVSQCVHLLLVCLLLVFTFAPPAKAAPHPRAIQPLRAALKSFLNLPPEPRPLYSVTAAGSALAAHKHTTGSWSSWNRYLHRHGFTPAFAEVMEGFSDFSGGKHPGQTGALTTKAQLTVQTQSLFGLRGGKAYIGLWDHAGRNPSKVNVGDLQGFDKLNYTPYFQIYEIWYQQRFWGSKLRIKAGKLDANDDFSVNLYGLNFLSGSAQQSPTEFTVPTTPAPMPGVEIFYSPNPGFYSGFAFFHANSSVGFLNFYGHPEAALIASNGNVFFGESGFTWNRFAALGNGYAKIGYWGDTGDLTRFDGTRQSGTQGLYAILGQQLEGSRRPGSIRGVRAFVQYGLSNPAVAKMYRYFGGGLTWTGILPGRGKDMLGFGPEYVRLSPGMHLVHGREMALESFYRVHVSNWAILDPDFQYIVHPGGKYPSALVAVMRFQVTF